MLAGPNVTCQGCYTGYVSETVRRLDDLEWVGGHPALDFVNTVRGWENGRPGAEYLHDYDHLLRWNRQSGLIDPRLERHLRAGAGDARPAAHREALRFRQSLHALLRAAARDASLPAGALEHLGEVVRRTARWRTYSAKGPRVVCGWDFRGAPPDAVLGPLARTAARLLEEGPLDRIKECPPPEGCGWLFLDASRNRSRTWCSMKTCGNTAKVRRFRARHGG